VAREKGRRALAEEVTTIASINAKIDRLRLAGEAGAQAIAEARRENARRAKKGPGDAA
jgi:outer membrane murein-binding lipoprotein Lpp